MSDIYKFPCGGYDVEVFKKQDILDSITNNIIDKDVVLTIIEQCEKDVANYLKQGKWSGIPFIGNIRIPKIKQLESTPEQQALIEDAKTTLDNNSYILFRAQLGKENSKKIKQERYYKYILSIAISHNKTLYKNLCNNKGETFARLYLYTSYNMASIDTNSINLDNNE